jgi:hypothetical protein
VARANIPEIVFLDAANGPQLTDFGSRAKQLDTHMSSDSDVHIFAIRELGRSGVWVPFRITWDQLSREIVSLRANLPQNSHYTYVRGDEDSQWTGLGKEAVLVYRNHDSINLD